MEDSMTNDTMMVGQWQYSALQILRDPWAKAFADLLKRPPGWYTRDQTIHWYAIFGKVK